jgi:hypothetical protein
MSRKQIPTFRPKDAIIADKEAQLRALALGLAKLSPDTRFTFFWQQTTNLLRGQGYLLPGDGRGGLIAPKKDGE